MMNYDKIIQTCIRIKSLESQIFEYYRFLGANNPPKEIDDQIRSIISDLEVDKEKHIKTLKKETSK